MLMTRAILALSAFAFAMTVGAGPVSANDVISRSIGLASLPAPGETGELIADGNFVYTLLFDNGPRGDSQRLVRSSLVDHRRRTIWRGGVRERYWVDDFAAGGGVVAISMSSESRGGAIHSKILRIDATTGSATTVSSGYAPGSGSHAEGRTVVGEFCGDFVDATDVTEAGEVIVHRLTGTRTGVKCKQAENRNYESFTAVGMHGEGTVVYAMSREVVPSDLTDFGDDPRESGFLSSARSAGRLIAVSDGASGVVVNLDTLAASAPYVSPVARKRGYEYWSAMQVNARGGLLINDWRWDNEELTGDLIRPFYFPIPGDPATHVPMAPAKRNTVALLCDEGHVLVESEGELGRRRYKPGRLYAVPLPPA